MASYLFRTPVSKAEEARKLVAKYAENRVKFVAKVIATAIVDTEQEVVNVALGYGRNSLKFDIEKYLKGNEQFTKVLEELRLKDFNLRAEERDHILEEITTALQASGFEVVRERANLLTVSWPEPVPPVEEPTTTEATSQ